MNDRIFEFDPLIEGVLIKRYKRFLADIKLESGELVTAHCSNTGPMKGLLSEGAKVRISVSHSQKRKLPFTWEQICVFDAKKEEVWVGINTLFANSVLIPTQTSSFFAPKTHICSQVKGNFLFGEGETLILTFAPSCKSPFIGPVLAQ